MRPARRKSIMLPLCALLAAFALAMLAVNLWTLRRAGKGSDEAALRRLLPPVATALDTRFLAEVEAPMRRQTTDGAFVSFAFAAPASRPDDADPDTALTRRLQAELRRLVEGSDAITGAFAWSAASNALVASPAPASFPEAREVLRHYQSGALAKQPIPAAEGKLSLLRRGDAVLIVRELGPGSGEVAAALFAALDVARLAAPVAGGFVSSGDVALCVYDSAGGLLFGEAPAEGKEPQRDSRSASSRLLTEGLVSDVTGWRFAASTARDFPLLPGRAALPLAGLAAALVALFAVLISRLFSERSRRRFERGDSPTEPRPRRDVVAETSGEGFVAAENAHLRATLTRLAPTAAEQLLFRLLSGLPADVGALEAALRHAGIYSRDGLCAAGLAVCEAEALQTQDRMLQGINAALAELSASQNLRAVALPLDPSSIALALFFPADASLEAIRKAADAIAAGLPEAVGQPMALSFGRAFHAVADLPLSLQAARLELQNRDVPSRPKDAVAEDEAPEAAESDVPDAEPEPSPEVEAEPAPFQDNPHVAAVMAFVEENYADPNLSLETIAARLDIAPNYLSTLFSKVTGKKLFDYVNEVRLAKSIELLVNTRDTVDEICERSGFGSHRNYIRIFKKHMNMTPTAYRRQELGTGGKEPGIKD